MARSAIVVVAVPTIRAFGSGCMLDVEVVCRQGTLSEDDWWDLFMSVHGGYSGSQDGRLPDKLLRLGVRYGDGAKATTLDQYDRRTPASDEPPAGPLLTHWPGHGGMHGRELGFSGFGLWLWPLPPRRGR